MKLYTAIIAVVFCLVGCIIEYNPKLNSVSRDYMVVEGIITDGQTVVSLHWSETLDEQSTPDVPLKPRPVSGALIRVESESGASFPSDEIFEEVEITDPWGNIGIEKRNTGRYSIETGALDDNTRYRLRIEYNGNEFVSEWRAPQITPPIEKLDISKDESSGMIEARVDVTGEADGARNYLWSYEETWQIRAPINATHYLGLFEGDHVERVYSFRDTKTMPWLRVYSYPNYLSPYYNCWKYSRSQELLIADTGKLTENSLRDHILFEFIPSNDRLSVLYHIKLNQFAVADDAYLYFTNLKAFTDDMGGIFAPIPSEMPGNLLCTTSPDIYMIGFVEVSHAVVHEMYIPRAQSPYEPPATTCSIHYTHDKDSAGELIINQYNDFSYTVVSDYSFDSELDTNNGTFAFIRCLDCRLLSGTKRRPSWWPTPDQ